MMKLPVRAKIFITVLLVAALSITTSYAEKTSRTYQVNVIVFERDDIDQLLPEHFDLPTNIDDDGIYLLPIDNEAPAATYPPLTLQPYAEFGMKDELLHLFRSLHYKVLLAFSWWQPFDTKEDFKTINILGGSVTDPMGMALNNEQLFWMAAQQDLYDSLQWQLKGNLHINLNRYFELSLHLQLKQNQQNTFELGDDIRFTPYRIFTIDQTIRARSKKIYYFDNPGFGVIVELIPRAIPTTEITEDGTNKE